MGSGRLESLLENDIGGVVPGVGEVEESLPGHISR